MVCDDAATWQLVPNLICRPFRKAFARDDQEEGVFPKPFGFRLRRGDGMDLAHLTIEGALTLVLLRTYAKACLFVVVLNGGKRKGAPAKEAFVLHDARGVRVEAHCIAVRGFFGRQLALPAFR